ncbi:MAG: right-handed parallel beta-helix repeat-containing protein [Candidatus Sungbacteria bacterium]|nr:right-handed parallel beta-helix repeat-containing protein [Candidatus Sungbacteria bacterium]
MAAIFRIIIAIGGIVLAIFSLSAFAYSPHYTHPDLTEEMVEFYNSAAAGKKIDARFLTLMRQGAIDEDTNPRWINHFYDPQSGEGWTGEHLGPHDKELVQEASQRLIANFVPLPAPVWAEDQDSQNLFISYGWNHTWQKAIYDYVNGDEEKAFESLGYVLHLIEDMSVPDHTRNDSHPHVAGDPGSPYEEWVKDFTNSNRLDTAEKLLKEKAQAPEFFSLREAFDYTARYSNENFFSEETITDKKYSKPIIYRVESKITPVGEVKYIFGKDESEVEYLLAFAKKSSDEIIYTLIGTDQEVLLMEYFFRLSRRSVLAGAGVIDLFFREAEKAKQNPELLEPPPSPPNSLGTIGTYFSTRVFSPYGAISSLFQPLTAAAAKINEFKTNSVKNFKETIFGTAGLLYGSSVTLEDLEGTEAADSPKEAEAQQSKESAAVDSQVDGVEENLLENEPKNDSVSAGEANLVDAGLENSTPVLLPPTPDSAIKSGGLPSGGGSSGGVPAGAGAAPALEESSLEEPESGLDPDTTPPDVVFPISECSYSISTDTCLLVNPTLNLLWSSTATDTDHFEITCEAAGVSCAGFSFSPTTATATRFTLTAERTSYAFKAKAVDAAGNKSGESTKTVEFVSRPVAINEIAWMGTGSSATANKDEWIELYNTTNYAIQFSGWPLSFFAPGTTTASHTIQLAGAIPAKGFYLIERTDDNVVADIAADIASSFGSSGLLNSGLIIKLQRGSAEVDRTPELCFNAWCAGSAITYSSMERIDPLAAGDIQSNWGTHHDLGANIKAGINVESAAINGTPKARNSRNYLIASPSCSLSENKTLKKENSPFIIPASSSCNIPAGITLTIEPGVVIKMGADAEFIVAGKISAAGTTADKIIFTSIHDDGYGGDTNLNGTSTTPAAGDWRRIKIANTSEASAFNHVFIRYGGLVGAGNPIEDTAMLAFVSAPVDIKNSVVENSYTDGAYLLNSSGTVSGTVFRSNCSASIGYCFGGLQASGGGVTVSGNTFEINKNGFSVSGNHTVSGNTFTGNTGDAIKFAGGTPVFSGNSVSGNGVNGIQVNAGGASYTYEKDLPYVMTNSNITLVEAGNTVTVRPGAVFKSKGQFTVNINGLLKIEGSVSSPVVFSSIYDDAYGGDTNNDGICGAEGSVATCPTAGDWGTILFSSGAASSTLDNLIVRYGASYCNGPCAAIQTNNAAINISNATIEKNKYGGIRLENSATTTISSSVVREHISSPGVTPAVGLALFGSNAVIDGVTFSQNTLGVSADGSSVLTVGSGGVVFDGNTTDDSPSDLVP